jgi:branched-subunit amino acid transport protein
MMMWSGVVWCGIVLYYYRVKALGFMRKKHLGRHFEQSQ